MQKQKSQVCTLAQHIRSWPLSTDLVMKSSEGSYFFPAIEAAQEPLIWSCLFVCEPLIWSCLFVCVCTYQGLSITHIYRVTIKE